MPRHVLKIFAALAAAFVLAGTSAAQGLIRDAEIESILREWTDPILEVAGLEPNDVGLYVINDPELNAFVANGQNIHLHTGLITAAETPGQIKGVIGHETCHIACGHTVTRSRAAARASRPALISIGLGVLAIAAGAGDAGAALIASSQQFAAVNFFVHTRAEEAAADAAAVSYLAALGQSPSGIVEFFENYRYQEVLSDARRYQYFRAHPLASDRIRTTRNLAEQTGLMDVEPDERTQRQFEMMQAKLIGYLDLPARVYQKYPRTDESLPARYARAHAALRAADFGSALKEADALLEAEPENPYFHELKGFILFESGRFEESVAPYASALEYLPGNALIEVAYARSLIARAGEGDLEAGENALRDALIVEPDNAYAWYHLAAALDAQGRRPEAQLATAESAFSIGDIVRAHSFARRARDDLERGTPRWRRADDIVAITDPSLEENRRAYERAGQRRVGSLQ